MAKFRLRTEARCNAALQQLRLLPWEKKTLLEEETDEDEEEREKRQLKRSSGCCFAIVSIMPLLAIATASIVPSLLSSCKNNNNNEIDGKRPKCEDEARTRKISAVVLLGYRSGYGVRTS